MNRMLKILAIAMALAAAPAAMADQPQASPSEARIAVEGAEPQVKGGIGKVAIDTPQALPVAVYSITGQLVKEFQAAPGHYDIELPKGCYIVRVGAHTIKTIVK